MTESLMICAILLPALFGALTLVLPRKGREAMALLIATANLLICLKMYGQQASFSLPWAGFGMLFELRLYQFSSFILSAVAALSLMIVIFSLKFMANRSHTNQFYAYLLISLALTNGAVLADNLILMLFFWEGLLGAIFGFITIGGRESFRSAIKAFVLVGVSDILMMVGIVMTGFMAGTLTISRIHLSPDSALGGAAFLLLAIGATSKAGCMPFHSWIPDAAVDAPLPFMAFMPAILEKLMGIYFLARICLDLFTLTPGSWLSPLLMTLGVVTILLAVMMALIQKDYKRLLSYHAISQVGYMILGIGTAVPVGIVGGIFHMLNHAMYKSCLFLTSGSVEAQTGTTDLKKLGGMGLRMPITFTCFIFAAAAISGVPPFNGFFSKELVYDGALERHWIFYLGALAGSFLTAASFLKLGHAVFLGKPEDEAPFSLVKEAPLSMLLPMVTIAGGCLLFGVANHLPLDNLIVPIIGDRAIGHHFGGFPQNRFLVFMTMLSLFGAWLNHIYGVRKSGKGVGASDHIHHSPLLHPIYERAEKRMFDPYDLGMGLVQRFSRLAWRIDRSNDWLYNVMVVRTAQFCSRSLSALHNGSYAMYMAWVAIGLILMGLYLNV